MNIGEEKKVGKKGKRPITDPNKRPIPIQVPEIPIPVEIPTPVPVEVPQPEKQSGG